jgi:hypothetical protein
LAIGDLSTYWAAPRLTNACMNDDVGVRVRGVLSSLPELPLTTRVHTLLHACMHANALRPHSTAHFAIYACVPCLPTS